MQVFWISPFGEISNSFLREIMKFPSDIRHRWLSSTTFTRPTLCCCEKSSFNCSYKRSAPSDYCIFLLVFFDLARGWSRQAPSFLLSEKGSSFSSWEWLLSSIVLSIWFRLTCHMAHELWRYQKRFFLLMVNVSLYLFKSVLTHVNNIPWYLLVNYNKSCRDAIITRTVTVDCYSPWTAILQQ